MSSLEELQARVTAAIDAKQLVQDVIDMVNIQSPTGSEQPAALALAVLVAVTLARDLIMGLVALIGAILRGIWDGILGLLGTFVRSPIALTTVGLLAACLGLVTGCIFVAVKPGGVGTIGVSWPFFVFGTAVVMGVAACQMLSKEIGRAHV